VIAKKPVYPPGKKCEMSSVGYTIAGAMAEKVTGATLDDLVRREVFEPLKLTEAGFGPPKSADATLEQPGGHLPRFAGKVPMDDKADNTPIMGALRRRTYVAPGSLHFRQGAHAWRSRQWGLTCGPGG
jgi:CubicO group peptidase (beta-lactamase class C family)